MSALIAVPPALPPLVGCILALCCLWIGWKALRTRSAPLLFKPMVWLNTLLLEMAASRETERQEKAPLLAAETVRVYGWAFVYAGALGLIIAGGQLLRLIAAGLG